MILQIHQKSYSLLPGLICVLLILIASCADNADENDKSDIPAAVTTDTTQIPSSDVDTAQFNVDTSEQKSLTGDVTKLALLKSDVDGRYRRQEHLVIFRDAAHATQELRNYGLWYSLRLPAGFNRRDKERLALYVYGYLSYHDANVRDNVPGHTIYFDWKGPAGNPTSVDVYITPRPIIGAVTDPPRPKVPPPPPMGIDLDP